MSNHIEIIDPRQFDRWDDWVLSVKHTNVFHSRSWARILMDSYGYKPHYLMLLKQGKPLAAWPLYETRSLWKGKNGVSLPFSDHCEPLLSDDVHFQTLFREVAQHAKQSKWRNLELRGGGRFLKGVRTSATYNLHRLQLSSTESDMAKRLRSSTKRNIKKALKQHILVSRHTSLEAVHDFYRLNCMTRKHHGLPPQPFSFFRNLHRHLVAQGSGLIVLAHHGSQLVAGAVFLHFGNVAMYKYGASDRDFLASRPNNLVMWEAIKWYGRRGYRWFDMGRSEVDNLGLNQFKNGWGTTVETISYFRYDPVQKRFTESVAPIPHFFNEAFRRTPLPVLKLFGTLAYRHMA
jgi:CelD/BcsL family acetyltransferase involved in cellulose biosynthesis